MFSANDCAKLTPRMIQDIGTKSQGFEHSYYNLNDAQDE